MTHSPFGAGTTFDLYQVHKSLGFAALALTALRIARAPPPPRPRAFSGWEGLVSRAVQAAFYVLTLAAIAAGWLVVSASPLPVPTRVFGLFVDPEHRPARRDAVRPRRSRPCVCGRTRSPPSSRCMSQAR